MPRPNRLHAFLALLAGAVVIAILVRPRPTGVDDRPAAAPPSTTSAPAPWLGTRPAAAAEFARERIRMVATQISHPRDGRDPVRDPDVLEAMRTVPRHLFVPREYRRSAYDDTPLPIGHGQTISQPYIVALMTEHLRVEPDSRILEVGTGSGYQAAVLAHLTPHVYTIEIVEPLARQAERTLRELGYTSVKCRYGDGYLGWTEAAPFDGIIVTCAADDIPEPLWEQLRPGGRMVIPTGSGGYQQLVVVTKTPDGQRKTETITAVRFVPLVRTRPG